MTPAHLQTGKAGHMGRTRSGVKPTTPLEVRAGAVGGESSAGKLVGGSDPFKQQLH